MADMDWSKFNVDLDKHLKTVKNTFLDQALFFDDGLIQGKDGDEETEEEKNRRKEEILELLHEENGESKLIERVNSILAEKNNRIKELKSAFWNNKDNLDTEYDKNKETCKVSWQTIENYLHDKDGFIHFLSKSFQNQHKELDELNGVKEVIEKKKHDLDCSFCCKFVLLSLLIIGCIWAQVFLFSQLKVCNGEGVAQNCYVLANCMLVVAMIVLLVCEVFSALGFIRLSRKKNNILQRLDLILNKIDMRKVTKFEIDRDLEKVLEEMK